MGPAIVFDKSFIQSLSIDESVWFDNFFISVVCPIFYSETLADLGKQTSQRSPEQEVSIIADKTPQIHASPTMGHWKLTHSELKGYPVNISRRPVLGGGKRVISNGRRGIRFDHADEFEAFFRWQRQSFREIERDFAAQWREMLSSSSLFTGCEFFNRFSKRAHDCKQFSEIAQLARTVADATDSPRETISFIFDLISFPSSERQYVWSRYQYLGHPPIRQFAPYIYHILYVEAFFYFAVLKGLISKDRFSNKIDFAYYYYTPFASIFVSSDKIHKNTSRFLLSEDQTFVWGPELKADLANINTLYRDNIPPEIKSRGLGAFATRPHPESKGLTVDLWDKYLPNWRDTRTIIPPGADTQKLFSRLVGENEKETSEAFPLEQADSIGIKRMVSKKKGSWYQLPIDLKG